MQIGFSLFKSGNQRVDMSDEGMVARLRELGVREDALRAAKLFQDALAPLEALDLGLDGERRPRPEQTTSVYVNSPVDGYCGVCGVDTVEGPGAESCKSQQSCEGFEAPPGYEGLVE